MVNNLEIKKVHVALFGALLGLVALLAVVAAAASGGAPAMEILYNVIPNAIARYITWSNMFAFLSAVASGSSLASALAILSLAAGPGGAVLAALRAIGVGALRYLIKRYGLRAVTSY